METGVPSLDTVIHNRILRSTDLGVYSCPNELVKHFCIMSK